MNNSTIVFLINDNVRAIEAVYDDTVGSKPEIFKTFDTDIEVDDLLVVQSSTRHMVTTVKVTAVDVEFDLDTGKHMNWVIQRIDTEAFKEVLAQEGEAISAVQSAERARKKEELRKSVFADQTDKINTLKLANHTEGDGVTE